MGVFDQHFEQGFLGVETVLRLVPGDRAWIVEQVDADLFAAVGRQAVHEYHVIRGQVEERLVDLVGGE
ncbi:hypothetical protein D3C79_1038370 [compost metagenome]